MEVAEGAPLTDGATLDIDEIAEHLIQGMAVDEYDACLVPSSPGYGGDAQRNSEPDRFLECLDAPFSAAD
ncbi:hypothetical protein ACGFMM_31250 [Streptomyces sp. NPDC048604]|uniref:hypothetical protein n=1 Tax=Streptomyces sp. NPDC048604 TaxID=3365578 RepID=UPI003715076A